MSLGRVYVAVEGISMINREGVFVAWKIVAQVRLLQGSRIAFVLNANEAGKE
jgi:hypothetical protein